MQRFWLLITGLRRQRNLSKPKKLLEASDANLIGSVLNMKHTPSLKRRADSPSRKAAFSTEKMERQTGPAD